MLHLPRPIISVLRPFHRAFRAKTWDRAQVLLVGAIVAPKQRTVTSALRILGLRHERQFQRYHRVLNRASWSSRSLSHLLLMSLLRAFVPDDAPVIVGIDETIERRRGGKIAAKGIYRDPVRSSKEHFVKTSGLRWVTLQLLAPIPWVQRVWALPFFSVLAPSERYHQQCGKRHKKVPDWGRLLIVQLRRWLPFREVVVVADSTYAALDLLATCQRLPQPVTLVTRLRLDAALYDPAPMRTPASHGRPRVKGARQPTLAERVADPTTTWRALTVQWYGGVERTLEVTTDTAVWYHSGMAPVPLRWVLIRDPQGQFPTQALLSTTVADTAQQIVERFVLRWHLEVTYHEARTHLGGRNATAMVGAGNWAHDADPAGAVLGGYLVCAPSAGGPGTAGAAERLVHETRADLCRYTCLCPPAALACHPFFHVPTNHRCGKNPTSRLRACDRNLSLCCLKGIKPSSLSERAGWR